MAPKKRIPPSRKGKKLARKPRFPLWIPALAAGIVLLLAGGGFMTMMKLEDTNTFCASCHTQPETTYVARAAAQDAVDAASQHMLHDKTNCIDCHSGSGLTGRAGAMLLGARNAERYLTKTMAQPAVQSVPIGDSNCVKCHQDVIQSESFKGNDNHYHFFLARWQAAQPGQAASCVDCHNGHKLNGDATMGFINGDDTQATCNRCHTTLGGS